MIGLIALGTSLAIHDGIALYFIASIIPFIVWLIGSRFSRSWEANKKLWGLSK